MVYLVFILVCLIWGSSFILMKWAAPLVGPVGVGCYRMLLGSLTLLGVWYWRKTAWPLGRRHLGPLVLLVVVGYITPFVIQPYVIHKHANSGFFGLMVTFVPLLTIAASIPLLGVYPTAWQLLGVAGGLLCLLPLAWDSFERSIPLLDLALGLCVPITYALANTYMKRAFRDVPALPLTCLTLGLGGMLLLPFTLTLEPVQWDAPESEAADDTA